MNQHSATIDSFLESCFFYLSLFFVFILLFFCWSILKQIQTGYNFTSQPLTDKNSVL